MPSSKNRLRHLITVFSATSKRVAIAAFSVPSAAASTILARNTTRRSAVALRANPSSRRRSSSLKTITNGLRLDTRTTHVGHGRPSPEPPR